MICNQNTKFGEKSKLLAVIAALVVVACALVAVLPSTEVSGEPMQIPTAPAEGDGVVYIDGDDGDPWQAYQEALADASVATIVVTVSIDTTDANETTVTIPADKTVYIGSAANENSKHTVAMTIGPKVTLNIEGKVYNLLGVDDDSTGVINNGTVVFSGHGLMASTCAVTSTATQAPYASVTGFFTANDETNVMKHYYGADINDIAGYVVANTYTDSTAGKAIHTYGDVTVDSLTVDLSDTTIVVGGVTATTVDQDTIGASTLTIASGVEATIGGLNIKSVSSAVNNGTITVPYDEDVTTALTIAGKMTNNGTFDVGKNTVTVGGEGSFTNSKTGKVLSETPIDGASYEDGAITQIGNRIFTVYREDITITTAQNGTFEAYFYLAVSLGSPTYTGYVFSLAELAPRAIALGGLYEDSGMTTALTNYKEAALNAIVNTDYSATEEALAGMIDAKDYQLQVQVNVSASGVDITSGAGTYYPLANFTIQPKQVDVTIEGVNDAYMYTGEPIEPEVQVYIDTGAEGEEHVLLDPSQYDVAYGENTTDSGSVTVTLKGNYAGTAQETFEIRTAFDSITVENTIEQYYIGAYLNTEAITITGHDGAVSETIDNGDVKFVIGDTEYNYFTEAGDVTVYVYYNVDEDTTLPASFKVKVNDILNIEVGDVAASTGEYDKEYDAGDSVNSYNMTITVNYENGAYMKYKDETAENIDFVFDSVSGISNIAFNTDFGFDPEVLDTATGQVDVYVTYCGSTYDDPFTVTVNGNIVMYMYYDENGTLQHYGSQTYIPEDPDNPEQFVNLAVYGFAIDAPEGKAFEYWTVQGTNVVYYPGDMIEVDGDDHMWKNGVITLIAHYSDVPEVEPEQPQADIVGSGFYANADAAKAAIQAISGITVNDAIPNTVFVAFDVTVPGQTMTGTFVGPDGSVYIEDMAGIAGTKGMKVWYFSFDDQLRNYDFVSGVYTVTVTIDGVSVTEKIYIDATPVQPVPEVTLKDIIVDAQTQYEAGQTFQVDAVYAVYSDGSVVDVTDDAVYFTGPLALGTTEVTVTYGGITKAVDVSVQPAPEVTLKDIIVDAQTQYEAGQTFQVNAVYAVYSDGTIENVTADAVYSDEALTTEVTEVEVSYGGITKTVDVSVQPAPESEPVTDNVILGLKNDGTNVYVSLVGVEGVLPAGSVTITYTYMEYDEFFQTYLPVTVSIPIITIDGGDAYTLLTTPSTAFTSFSTIVNITVSFADGEDNVLGQVYENYNVNLE